MTPGVRPGAHPISTGTVELLPDANRPRGWLVLINGLESSYVDLADPTWLEFEYVRWMGDVLDLAAPSGQPLDVLHLGGGGCTLPQYVAATRPGSTQRVLEIDPELLALVREAFGLDELAGVDLQATDAAAGLGAQRTASYDVVIRDAFDIDVVPAELTTLDYLTEVARVLSPGGIYLANVPAGADLHAARAEARLAASCFPTVIALVDPGQLRGRRFGNVVLLATAGALGEPAGQAALARRLAAEPAPARLVSDW